MHALHTVMPTGYAYVTSLVYALHSRIHRGYFMHRHPTCHNRNICRPFFQFPGRLLRRYIRETASFHCGSGCQDAQAYPAAIEVARAVFDLAARHGVKLTLLDIGGGFPGWDGSEYVYQQNRDVADYAVNPVGASPWKEALDVDDMQRRRGPEEGDGGIPDDHVAAIPPLSLEKIAEATLPVLDKLFPPSSGVQVNALKMTLYDAFKPRFYFGRYVVICR